MENRHILNWLSSLESDLTKPSYLWAIQDFIKYCQSQGASFNTVVEDWRTARYKSRRAEQMFLDTWQDLIQGYAAHQREQKDLAPLTLRKFQIVVKSFFSFHKIPLEVDLPKRACVQYHNRDFTRERIRAILSKASQRDRAIFLLITESGLRGGTVVNLKYEQIQEDFEKGTVPMMILTPASTIKDHVGDRWSFIGEDGAKALREYLEPRLPLKAQDYVFASGKPSRVKGKQFTEASISTIFHRLTQHLKMENGNPQGKPSHYRLHGLRKFFFNNMAAPKQFLDFWMGHTLGGSDEHYITRDPEKHRAIYAKGYPALRILEAPKPETREIDEKLAEKDKQIQALQDQIKELRDVILKEVIEKLKGTTT